MISMANHLVQVEKAWLLSQIGTYVWYCRYRHALLIRRSVLGLIPDCDDDVMDEVCFHEFPVEYRNLPFNSKNGVLALGYFYRSL